MEELNCETVFTLPIVGGISESVVVTWIIMAVLVLAILPIIVFYIICQKYIIEGVLAGAVKG